MTARPRWQRSLIAAAFLLALAVPIASVLLPHLLLSPPAARPRVTMLTSLPIGMAASPSLAATLDPSVPPDPLLARLRDHVVLSPLDTFDAATLAQTDTLLLAHPHALPPAMLVLIDDWLRAGGRAVILADGLSSWPTVHPLGDPRNPPVTSLLTPLLGHWGLTLDAPPGMVATTVDRTIGPRHVRFVSPGRLSAASDGCRIVQSGIIGDCRVGRGRAIVIADADFLDPALWAGQGAVSSSPGNIAWMLDILTDVRYTFPIDAPAVPTR